MTNLRGISRGLDEGAGDIFEEGAQIDFLLIPASRGHLGDVTDDGNHRLVIEAGIVEAIEQMDGAGSLGSETNTRRSGKFGLGARHETRVLFVPDLNECRV